MKLKVPIYFYYPNIIPLQVDYKSGLDCWVLKTFWKLKESKSNLNIHLVNYIPNEGIIIFHKGFFPQNIKPSINQLLVCVQADYGRYKYAQCHIAQNPLGVSNFKFSKRSYIEEKFFAFSQNFFVAHWNQDKIIRRNSLRDSVLKNLCFYGINKNFPSDLWSPNFKEQLKNEKIELHMITDSTQWNDYSTADCVLAIRDFSNKPHYNKPFSKIINSYLAGVPVIAGNESSAIFLNKEIGIRFPIVRNSEECLNAIKSIKRDYANQLNNVIVDAVKLNPYYDERITEDWNTLFLTLQGTYLKWKNSHKLIRKIYFQFRK